MKPANGKLGVMIVGLGAVSTTFITGVLMARKGLAKPVGAMTQYDKIRVGRGAEKQYLKYADIISLASLDDMVFGAWDVYPANAFESAVDAEVLRAKDILPVEDELKAIRPLPAAFDKRYASRLEGDNVKDCATRWDMVEALREDIRRFKADNGCERVVVLWAASTEIYVPVDEAVHYRLADLEAAMKANDTERIAPSMCYAYAALAEGAPFVMGAPNTTVDIPAMWELAEKTQMPIAGKDFKTGQTLVKSGFAPIIGTRCLGLNGWFSTNILGNRDGLVLDEPANFHTKEVSKLSTLESILVADEQPDLYTDRASLLGPRAPHRRRRARWPLRHATLLELLPQKPATRLHARRSARKPLVPSVHEPQKRHSRNGWLRGRRNHRLISTPTSTLSATLLVHREKSGARCPLLRALGEPLSVKPIATIQSNHSTSKQNAREDRTFASSNGQ